MKNDFELTFGFKGERNYVQGPDIHDALVEFLRRDGIANVQRFDLAVHKIIRSQVSGHFIAPAESADANAGVGVTLHADGDEHHIVLKENGKPITERKPYPEEIIVGVSALDLANQTIKC